MLARAAGVPGVALSRRKPSQRVAIGDAAWRCAEPIDETRRTNFLARIVEREHGAPNEFAKADAEARRPGREYPLLSWRHEYDEAFAA